MNTVILVQSRVWSPAEHAYLNSYCPPLGIGYLAACLESRGAHVIVLDMNTSLHDDAYLSSLIVSHKPLMVGFSSYTQNYALALQTAERVKRLCPDTFVIMGGPHVSYEYRDALSHDFIDAVARFEAEYAIVDLYEKLLDDARDLSGIPGIAYRGSPGEVIETHNRPFEKDLDRFPFPARHLLPMDEYARPGTIQSSRGCPKKCIFCIASTFEGQYRTRSAENVVEEIGVLRYTYNIHDIYMIDNVFTVNARRVERICDLILNNGIDIRFHCVSRADLVTPGLIARLKEAGCVSIEIGVESGSQEIIDLCQKGIALEDVRRAADITLNSGIRPMFTFQIGSPYETAKSLSATLDLAEQLRRMGAITLFSVMTPFPGTPMLRDMEQLGLKVHADSWYDYRTSNPVYDTRQLTRNDFRKALYSEYGYF